MSILFLQTRILLVKEALLYILEDCEVVIKMIIKGRSPTMRHVSRTHRVALDWLFDRINSDPKIQIKYIDTKNQLADILTKGNFTREEWNHRLCLFNISHFSSTNCLEVMSKRTQKDSGEERITAKSKPMMNLVSRCSERIPNVLASTASESLGKTRCESQILLSSWFEQQPRTERLVKDACSSSYSEWNTDEKWSSQEWKYDEVLEVRTERLVNEQPPGLFTQHTDRFIVDDDDMDSNTVTESDLSLKPRSFLHCKGNVPCTSYSRTYGYGKLRTSTWTTLRTTARTPQSTQTCTMRSSEHAAHRLLMHSVSHRTCGSRSRRVCHSMSSMHAHLCVVL